MVSVSLVLVRTAVVPSFTESPAAIISNHVITFWGRYGGGMSHILELKEHIYGDLALEFLSTLHVEVTRDPQCQARYISFYLQGYLYELN